MEETMKKMSFSGIVAVLLLLIAASANALSYESGNERLLAAGATVRGHDPEAMKEARKIFGDRIKYSHDQYDILVGADSLANITDWNEYRNPDFDRIRAAL